MIALSPLDRSRRPHRVPERGVDAVEPLVWLLDELDPAHELGHQKHNDLLRGLAWLALVAPAGTFLTQRLAESFAPDDVKAKVREIFAAGDLSGEAAQMLTERTGMDRSALSKLETGQRPNPTVETLVRLAPSCVSVRTRLPVASAAPKRRFSSGPVVPAASASS